MSAETKDRSLPLSGYNSSLSVEREAEVCSRAEDLSVRREGRSVLPYLRDLALRKRRPPVLFEKG